MEQIPPPKEVKILETAEDIQERREQVFTFEINVDIVHMYIFFYLYIRFLQSLKHVQLLIPIIITYILILNVKKRL